MKNIQLTQFNWDTAIGSEERIAWLRANHDKPITEAEYIAHEKALPHDHMYAAKCRTPSVARKRYAYLKQRFGFFGGTA